MIIPKFIYPFLLDLCFKISDAMITFSRLYTHVQIDLLNNFL